MEVTTKVIKDRVSVRSFGERKVPESVTEQLREYLGHIENPFRIPLEFRILDAKENGLASPVVLGADLYVAAKCRQGVNAELAFGYSFEKFILFATSLGLGTVWLAATINRKRFEKALALSEGEIMPAVSPIGYAAKNRSVREKLMRKGMKSDDRAAFETVFFKGDFQQGMKEDEAGQWLLPLQMLRLSPSATNKQPWRVIVDGNIVHFYEAKAKGYAKESTGDIQKVDLGIAICHFEIAAQELGYRGAISQSDPGIAIPADTEYIASYEPER